MSNDIVKKIKTIVKGSVPINTFGTDPSDPWSAKSNITEDNYLDDFLKSKGINSNFVSRETKISHAKSSEFAKWKQDRKFESCEQPNYDQSVKDHQSELHKTSKEQSKKGVNKLLLKYREKNKKEHHIHESAKMGQLIADIGQHIDKHIDEYKSTGGAEHLISKIDHTTNKIAAQHGLEHKHAHKFVSDYVEKKLHEDFNHSHVCLEDVYQDSQAATQTCFDMGTNPYDTVQNRKIQLSKSARIIKNLYRKKGMTEEIYDHEKEDKSVASYGKKPKMTNNDDDDDTDSSASAVMSGGKTLTGEPRDDIEIDPKMKSQPNQNGAVLDTVKPRKNKQ